MTFTIDEEEFNKNYKYKKVRGYVNYDARYVRRDSDRGQGDLQEKLEIDKTYIVYNQTLTPREGGEKAIYRECETESEAKAITRVLNSIFTSSVIVNFKDEEGQEDQMSYQHHIVQWAYA